MQGAMANVDAERAVLGCALSDAEALFRVLPLLQAQHFWLDSNRRIYHTMTELAESGKPVDLLTMTDALVAKRQLEAVGGVAYVGSLVDGNVVSNVEHYAQIVLDKSRRRQVAAAGSALLSATEDVTVSTEECLKSIQECLLQLEASAR
jgi:replicative DNA helicase